MSKLAHLAGMSTHPTSEKPNVDVKTGQVAVIFIDDEDPCLFYHTMSMDEKDFTKHVGEIIEAGYQLLSFAYPITRLGETRIAYVVVQSHAFSASIGADGKQT